MAEKNEITVNLDPQALFLSNITAKFSEEEFALLMFTGNTARQYVLTPKHAKRFLLLLERNVKEYESKFGTLETSLPEAKGRTKEDNGIGFKA